MFTGLIEEVGIIQGVSRSGKAGQMTIKANLILEGIKLGDSISTNGVCLTVIETGHSFFTVDVMPETMARCNLSSINKGDSVNLERALKLGDRLGGHMVSGHIDGIGVITAFENEDNAVWVTIEANEEILKYIVQKGSIAIDGVSLTVANVTTKDFKVSIIPHTKVLTTLTGKKTGTVVNLECDIIGKYIEKLLSPKGQERVNERINIEFLNKYGFL